MTGPDEKHFVTDAGPKGPVQNNVMSLMRGPDEIFFVFKNFLPRVMEQSESMVMGGEEMDGAD